MSSVDDLIREIAVEHGIAVGRDDPILILATVNKRLLEQSAAQQAELLQRFEAEIERIASTWSDDASAKAQKLLRSAADDARLLLGDISRRSAEAAADATAVKIRAEIEVAIGHMAKSVNAMRSLAIATVASAVLVLGTTLYLVLTVLRTPYHPPVASDMTMRARVTPTTTTIHHAAARDTSSGNLHDRDAVIP